MLSECLRAHLTILGHGELRGDLQALAVRLGVDQHVTFAGFVTNPDEYMRSADLFVLGSDFEGFGNVLVEALAHGLPIVATDVAFGPRFILEGVRSAQLVPRDDAHALGRAMAAALERPAEDALADEARARAGLFAISRTAEHFDRLAAAVRAGRAAPGMDGRLTLDRLRCASRLTRPLDLALPQSSLTPAGRGNELGPIMAQRIRSGRPSSMASSECGSPWISGKSAASRGR